MNNVSKAMTLSVLLLYRHITFAELVYNGQWYTPLREALSAFVDKTQERVSGKVRL